MPREQSFFEQLSHGIADAVADIREKVVEEPWFGRVVTERGEAMEWPEAREAEPLQEALSGEILGPEAEPMNARDSAGFLEHGTVLNGQAMNAEPSGQWPQARQELTYNPEQQHEREPERDLDIDR